MSAIIGIINFDGEPVNESHLDGMITAQLHRGRDGTGKWLSRNVGLGHCMFRTTIEARDEVQPLASDDGKLVLVIDGRVDNREDLCRELKARGCSIRSRSDAELVLNAYEVWGENCPEFIEGDFAFVIWDGRRQQLFCARDHIGNKPFFYHYDGQRLAFASELRPILDLPWVSEEPNMGMIAEVLADDWLTYDETLWRAVKRLAPAHSMRINQRRCQLQEYWRPDLAAPPLYKRDEEYFEHYREVFADSIRRASRSDEPIAIGFSGGHDSSAVFAMADKLDREGVLLAPSLAAFTCSFPGDADLDELEFAREVASHLGREIHISEPQLVDVKWLTDQAARYRDFPGYPFSGWAEAIYDSAGKQGSKVLLTGSFGDHCLAGSRSHYIEELAAGNFGNMVSAFRHDCGSYGALGASKLFLMSGVLPFAPEPLKALLRPLAGLGRRQAKQRGDHLSAELRTILANRKLDNAISPPRNPSDRPRRNLLRALSYPFDVWSLELGERIASANGFELRHPMNSRAFIEFAFQTPERLRSLGAAGKYIHIEALGDLLPMKLRRRETKADAASPVVDFIAPLRSHFVEALPLRRPSWVTQVGMEQLLSSFEGDGDNGWENWAILNALGCDLALP